MPGHSPSWRRNLYHRLHWHKRSGESFDLVWRLEEGLYRDEGWSEASRLGTTGMCDYSNIGPADSSVESVEQYLRRTKGWFDGDFRRGCERPDLTQVSRTAPAPFGRHPFDFQPGSAGVAHEENSNHGDCVRCSCPHRPSITVVVF